MLDLRPLCLAILALPLVAAGIAGLLGKPLGRRAASLTCVSAVGIAFVLACIVLWTLVTGNEGSLNSPIFIWAEIGKFQFSFGLLIDRLSSLMIVVVTFISCMVHIYTMGYMRDDPGYQRFFSYIALFTFGMLLLVMSNNFLQLFVGWEMVGLMSYLLIGFWYQKETAITANLKAFIVNRVGDFGFILGIAAVFYFFGSLDYQTVFSRVDNVVQNTPAFPLLWNMDVTVMTLICICLFIGAMGKSAQIPLHVWLPDSMEGPTPISALIHAATMVTAGVFMLARLSPLFEYSETALSFVLIIGALTAFLMGLVGIVQNDIKRIIAYSTISQLGYMMAAMGASAYPIGIFHLVTHAFFKALLFLGAGSVIIALHHEQNIWKMGNLRKYLPITYIMMWIGSLALVGFPPFSGYYSKDLVIEAVGLSPLAAAKLAHPLLIASVFITAVYTFRLLFVVFHNKAVVENQTARQSHPVHESPWIILVPLILLAIPSIIIGEVLVDPLFHEFFKDSIIIHTDHYAFRQIASRFEGGLSMAVYAVSSPPVWFAIAGIVVAWLCYIWRPTLADTIKSRFINLYGILQDKFGFDTLNQRFFVTGTKFLAHNLWQVGDKVVIDGVGVNGSARSIYRLGGLLRKSQSGYLYHYTFVMILGFLLLLVWLMISE